MAYQQYVIKDLGKGLNRYNPPDNVPEGMMTTLKNLDPKGNGQLTTRVGYEQYYGYIPLRVQSFSKTGTTYRAEFGSAVSIDLASTPRGPIVVSGDLTGADAPVAGYAGDFSTTFATHYYSSYDLTIRETFSAGTPATKTKTAAQTGLTSKFAFVGIYESDSTVDLSNTVTPAETLSIDEASFQVDVEYQAPSLYTGIFAFLPVPETDGVVAHLDFTSTTSVTLSVAAEGLNTTNYIVRCYSSSGGTYTEIVPATMSIDVNGDVSLTFSTATTGTAIVYAVDADYTASNSSAGSGPSTEVLTITGVTDPLNIYQVWLVSGSTRTAVVPQEISWDASTETVSITYLDPGTAETVETYWAPATYLANAIEFTDTGAVSESFETSSPEITVWGIGHEGIYKAAAPKGGFTHHIDNYKSALEERVVCGLGGNLLKSTTYSEGATTYKMPQVQLRGSNRVSGTQVLAPLFSSSDLSRTRTSYVDTSVNSDGYARVSAVSYVSSGVADYTFTFTSLSGDPSSAVDTYDYLTVRKCSRDRNNGTFKIVSVSYTDATSVTIRVENSACIDDSANETGIYGEGNVFTDRVTLTATSEGRTGDIISNPAITSKTIKATDDTYLYLDGITAAYTLSDGLNLYYTRTSSVLPLEYQTSAFIGNDTVGGLVIGDSLTIEGVTNNPRVKYVTTYASVSTSITVASEVATINISNHNMNVGQLVVINDDSGSGLEGETAVASVVDDDNFTIAATGIADGSYTCYIVGRSIEVDESLTLTSGPNLVDINPIGRWTVVENPKSTQARVPETKAQHWDALSTTAQPYTKSCVVNDSMFFVNGNDEVKKFDGTSIMDAGLIPWQPWSFITVDTTNSSILAGEQIGWDNGTSTPDVDKYFLIDTPVIKTGDRFKASQSGLTYRATLVEKDDVDLYKVYTDIAITDNTSTGTITKSASYRYYVRLNMVDANRNIVASAATGENDLYVDIFDNCRISLKLIGLPPFPEIDHDRIEIEVYRTKRNRIDTFYRVFRQLVDFSDLGGYIVFEDSNIDDSLIEVLKDEPMYSLLHPELGNTWDVPPNASVITTLDNRLILGNIKSKPILDVVFRPAIGFSSIASGSFNAAEIVLQKGSVNSGDETFNNTCVFSFEASKQTITPASEIYVGEDGWDSGWADGDVSSDTVNATNHGLLTGMKVRVSNTGGALPTGLSANTTYYIIRVDADNYKFATSFTNAYAGTAISLTTGGGGTHTTAVYGNHIVIENAAIGLVAATAWVYLFHAAQGTTNLLDFAGWYRVSESDGANAVLIDVEHGRSHGAASSSDVDSFCSSASSSYSVGERVPVFVGTDGNYNDRYSASAAVSTRVSTRLSVAINAVMSSDNPQNSYWTSSTPAPWLMARGGQSFNTGELQIILLNDPSGSIVFQHDIVSTGIEVFVNNLSVSTSTEVSSEIRLYNSRIAVSYPNFPEIFDNPFGDATTSDSVIDINPADGEEITAVIPFFGQSAFGAANLTQAAVVFKSSSVYLVNVATRQIQKLQTQGQGCTAPRSVSVTQDGIMFANESGIYKLSWDMKVSWIGKMVHDLWEDDLDLTNISEFAGHNFKQERKYKLSVVTSGNDYPSSALVYDHTSEAQGQIGSWTEYTNHNATGWANQNKNAFFGDQSGRIMKIRNNGDMTDYRDDASAIAEQQLITGGIDYGMPANRKTTNSVSLQYQNDSTLTDVSLSTEQSLSGTFNASTQVDISSSNQIVKYSLAERKGTYLRVKVTKSGTKDEQMKISKMVCHVKDIGDGGVPQAAEIS